MNSPPMSWVRLATTVLAGLMSAADKLKLDGLAAGAAVVSVFGRAGAVVAVAGDYVASKVTNDSSVSGAMVSDALNALAAYVDAAVQGLDIKASVRAIATTNITLSGAQTIDGVAVNAGDRVLAAAQTAAADSGIYVVAAGAWARANDANTSAKVTAGMYTYVTEGSAPNADSGWVLTTNDAIVLGTTALAFTQFSGAGQITVSSPIVKTGNALSLNGAAMPALTAPVYMSTPAAPAYAASVALDVGASNDFAVGALTGNITFTFTNAVAGRQGIIAIKQDGTGGRTVTFTAPATFTIIKDVGLVDLSAQSAANAITRYTYVMYALGGTNYLELSKVLLS